MTNLRISLAEVLGRINQTVSGIAATWQQLYSRSSSPSN